MWKVRGEIHLCWGHSQTQFFCWCYEPQVKKVTNSWFNISGSGLCGARRSARDQGGSVVSTPRLWPRGSLASAGREGKWLPVQIRSIVRASVGGKAPVLEYSSQCLGHFLNDIRVSASSVLAASSVLNSGSCRGQGWGDQFFNDL